MAYTGQPVPSTVYDAARAKVSDGKSVRVKSGSVKVEAGKFYYLEGFLGAAMTSAAAADTNKEIILNIEPAEYETDQIKADDKNSMTVGTDIYWDDTAGTKHFTVTATEIYAGKVTAAADENNVIWFKLAERPFALDNVTALSGQVGTLANLTTTDTTSIVAAINEVDGNVGVLDDLETTAQGSVVEAVNEVVEDIIGDLGDLDPVTSETSIVAVLNEKVAENVGAIADTDQLKVDTATDLQAVADKVNDLIDKLVAAKLMAASD